MNKSADDLIQELKEGKLSSFWISRQDDAPWADKITIVTKKQQSEIIDLFIDLLKTKKVIKVPKNKNVKGFCKKEVDLSPGIYYHLEEKDKDNDFLVYAEDGEYTGMTVITPTQQKFRWVVYINYLCSIKKGTGTKIINLIKDVIKTNQDTTYIDLSPLESAVDFYKKMGFVVSEMTWFYSKKRGTDVQLEEPKAASGGKKNGMRTLKLKHMSKNAKTTSRNIAQKSRKLI